MKHEDYPIENNKIKRLWIRLWYNNITRICNVLGLYLLIITLLLIYFQIDGESIKNILIGIYLFVFAWMCIDNDYGNLYRIGRDLNEKKLK